MSRVMFESAASFLRERLDKAGVAPPRAAVLLGSGMGGVLPLGGNKLSLPYAEIPGFPAARVAGHEGTFEAGEAAGVAVAVFRGRFHLYEGLAPAEVAAPVFVARALGAQALFQTSAVGGIGKAFTRGALALARDHVNMTGRDPLTNIPVEERNPAFTDLSEVYPERLRRAALAAARKKKIPLKEGVLAVAHGPSYETPAEVRALAALGADAVCMSGVCESAFAAYLGLPVLFLLAVTNRAAGLGDGALSHDDVVAESKRLAAKISAILEGALPAAEA